MDIGFAIGSIVRLQVPKVRMANGWALESSPGISPRHADLRWAAPIWSISASLLCVHSFTCPFVARHVTCRKCSNLVAMESGHRADVVDRSKLTQLRHQRAKMIERPRSQKSAVGIRQLARLS